MSPPPFWKRWLSGLQGTPTAEDAPRPGESVRAAPPSGSQEQKLRRTARREHLYAVVRESMIRAGVLSSAYKFKVLTLDHDGLSHVVLMDVQAGALQHLPERESQLESDLQALAMERLGLRIKSVYWRTLPARAASRADPAAAAPPAPSAPPGRPEAISEAEIDAFNQALAGHAPAGATHPLSAHYPATPDFQATQPLPRARDKGYKPLSDTQLGDLG